MLESPEQCVLDANATRYLNGIGLVVMLYDHILTFSEEVRLVWQAKPSFAKWLFLANRYLVPMMLIGVALFMNNFSNNSLATTTSCRRFFVITSLFGIISVGIANVLVLLRVVNLWERSSRIACIMFFGFMVSFCATSALMVVVLVKLIPGVVYFPGVHMCVSTMPVTEIKALWAAPMLFEVLVLLAVCLNAFDRPHAQNCEVKRALARDGIGFFAALTVLRVFNLLLATLARPSLIVLGVYFVWAMTTLVLNRALLNILKKTAKARARASECVLPSRNVLIERITSPALYHYPSMDKDFGREVYELR
ncbi:hypothetical protein ACEPAF_7380 [Sanghuangporus sanghuang]